MEEIVMKRWIKHTFGKTFGSLKLNKKIQISLLLLIIPLFILFGLLFFNIYKMNMKYDQIITNASKAGQFSIKFKEEFDYSIYLLIAGHSSFEEEDPYQKIKEARNIIMDLTNNTNLEDNKQRAENILRLLDNLEKYVLRIQENKEIGGHYDENITIWEKDIQIVTSLIQSTVLEYTYYETKGMEQIRIEIVGNFNEITLFTMIIFAVLVIMELILSIVIPNSIVRPIEHLSDVTNQVAKGDLTVRANVLYGAEVKDLSNSLNSMIGKIDYLLSAVKVEGENLREAELELLQAQIKPHFLYNTLDTIMWLAESGDQKEVVKMVDSLSDFFRTSLNHGDGMFTLREEERHVRSYLEIQQVRYQDILEYQIDFSEDTKDVMIPKITLQPIVENALYHGIKNQRNMGKIIISAGRKGDDVIITVKDNGVGMTNNQLDNLNQKFKRINKQSDPKKKKESYGLYNVNERIKLKFGNGYGITIQSVQGEGTSVLVKIPYQQGIS